MFIFSITTNFINLLVYVFAHGTLNKEVLCSLETCTQWPCISLTEAVINGYAHQKGLSKCNTIDPPIDFYISAITITVLLGHTIF